MSKGKYIQQIWANKRTFGKVINELPPSVGDRQRHRKIEK